MKMAPKDGSKDWTADYTSYAYKTNYRYNHDGTGLVQAVITGSASLLIEGASKEAGPYVEMKTYTANGADQVVLMPYMRVTASSVSGGEAYVELTDR